MKFESKWQFSDRVYIDGDDSMIGVVTAFQYRGERATHQETIEVSWVHNGESRAGWIEVWRLTKAIK